MKQKKKKKKLKWLIIVIVVLIIIIFAIGASGDSESEQTDGNQESSIVENDTEEVGSISEGETEQIDSDEEITSDLGDPAEETPQDYIFSGDNDNYPIYVYTKDTELIYVSKYVFMDEATNWVDLGFHTSVGDDSGNMELEVRRPEFGDDPYSLSTHDWDYKDLNDPIIITFATDMSYIDVSATWNENLTNEQSLYNGHYELEGIYTVEEFARKYYTSDAEFQIPD